MVAKFKEWLAYHQVTNPDAYTIRALACVWSPDDDTLFHICETLIGPDWLSL